MIASGLDRDILVYHLSKAFEDELRASMKEALKPIFEQAIEDAVQSIKVRMSERYFPEHMRTEIEVKLTDARTVFPTD